VLLNMSRFGMTPAQAVSAPRFHHQWSPNELLLEPAFDPELITELAHKGHRVVRAEKLGAAQAVARSSTGLTGGSDPRKGGQPRGW
jgi:gamma-glutamyltranspeptidase/glutathione hydrolase